MNTRRLLLLVPLLLAATQATVSVGADEPDLRTVAELSGFQNTARHVDVLELCRKLAERTDRVQLLELGRTFEDRSIPLLIVANPPVRTAQDTARSGKLLVLATGNIHAGEVEGKEALPALVRELTDQPDHPLLKHLILAVAPIYNADGNERVSRTNRPGQIGPAGGMGIRENAQGFDLNRDFLKLEAPETRALVQFVNEWDPHILIDCHTTNGSHHRYALTYQGPAHPAGDGQLIAFSRDNFFPAVAAALESKDQIHIFPYGNFNRAHTVWSTYGAEPRFGTSYFGLRNRLSVLSEAYSYISFEERIRATKAFVHAILAFAAKEDDALRSLLAAARLRDQDAGRMGEGQLAIRSKVQPREGPVTVLGFNESRGPNGRVVEGDPRDYAVSLVDRFVGAKTVERPWAYLIPETYEHAIKTLAAHGIAIEKLGEARVADVELDRIDTLETSRRAFQGHRERTISSTRRQARVSVPAGTRLVRTEQPRGLGALVVMLLEPESEDSLYTWNAFDAGLTQGRDAPVLRLPKPAPWETPREHAIGSGETATDAPEQDEHDASGGPAAFQGRFGLGATQWLDKETLLQTRQGKLMRVAARTGEATPFLDPAKVADALHAKAGLEKSTADSLASRTTLTFDPARKGILFTHAGDLYYAAVDGSNASRLTLTPEEEELASFSPDGTTIAFVRDYDLYAIDVEGKAERRLTTGGNTLVRNGKAVWVYFEELWNRSWKAYWWSPDSKHIVFLENDDRPVPLHHVLIDTGAARVVEPTPYPRAGEPNPRVRVGIATVAGGSPRYVEMPAYSPDSIVVSDAGWLGDGKAFAYVQNRIQTWLDMIEIDAATGATKRLFRDQTPAWIESLGEPRVLPDRSFLVLSDRDGWKHLYHYEPDGKLRRQLTKGEWEVRSINRFDPESGAIYVIATKDNPIGTNLYKVTIADGSIERLTQGAGTHSASVSPGGELVLDSWSSHDTPPQQALFESTGKEVRKLESAGGGGPGQGPGRGASSPRGGKRELLTIPARDGVPLQAELTLPSDLDPEKKYPVWFTTYGGPHAPTISDSYFGGGASQATSRGFVSFRLDPRSASGRGSVSTWSAYKKLGVQETRDIEDGIEWLKKNKPYVDGDRIGMSGHSYGGFMTSFAMTHTKLFAAGIAGAPVTDWHDYDSIYTERFMQTPQDNPEGYAETSVVSAAGNLHGKLLILHGAIDDNVSMRNTMRLVHALQQANKDFELMIYPSSRHGIGGAHYQRLMVEFMTRTLGGPMPKSAAEKPEKVGNGESAPAMP